MQSLSLWIEWSTFSFWMTLLPPAWQAAQLPAKTWAPFSKSAANAAGATAIMPAKKAAAIWLHILSAMS